MKPTVTSILVPTKGQEPKNRVVSITDFTLAILLLAIPVVNIMFILFWVFSPHTNKTLKKFAPAFLMAVVTTIVLYVLVIAFVLIKLVSSAV